MVVTQPAASAHPRPATAVMHTNTYVHRCLGCRQAVMRGPRVGRARMPSHALMIMHHGSTAFSPRSLPPTQHPRNTPALLGRLWRKAVGVFPACIAVQAARQRRMSLTCACNPNVEASRRGVGADMRNAAMRVGCLAGGGWCCRDGPATSRRRHLLHKAHLLQLHDLLRWAPFAAAWVRPGHVCARCVPETPQCGHVSS